MTEGRRNLNEALTDCLSNKGVRQPDLRKVAVNLRVSIRTTWEEQARVMENDGGLELPYKDSLR